MLIITLFAMCEVTFNTFRVITLAIYFVAFLIQRIYRIVWCIIPWITLTHLPINAISMPTTLRAMRNITYWTSPASFALTLVWSYRFAMNTWWITNGFIAICTLISIKAFTDFRWRADTVYTRFANPNTTNRTSPTRLTFTCIRPIAFAMHTWRRTDGLITVEASPTLIAFTTLSFIFHYFLKTSIKISLTRSYLIRTWKSSFTKKS